METQRRIRCNGKEGKSLSQQEEKEQTPMAPSLKDETEKRKEMGRQEARRYGLN